VTENCKHDQEWTQRQMYVGEDWVCSGCGMRMSSSQMLILNEVRTLKALLRHADIPESGNG
jgi:hypothetical protein